MIAIDKALLAREKAFDILAKRGFSREMLESISVMDYDLKNIYKAASGMPVSNILEIGSFVGVSAASLCSMFENAKIVCIDPGLSVKTDCIKYGSSCDKSANYYRNSLMTEVGLQNRYRKIEAFFSKRPDNNTIEYHKINNPKIMKIPIFIEKPVDLPKFDLIFIDADHYADSVYSDLKYAFPLLADGGKIFTHDICGKWSVEVRTGISRFLNENQAELEDYDTIGVIRKSDQFLSSKISVR